MNGYALYLQVMSFIFQIAGITVGCALHFSIWRHPHTCHMALKRLTLLMLMIICQEHTLYCNVFWIMASLKSIYEFCKVQFETNKNNIKTTLKNKALATDEIVLVEVIHVITYFRLFGVTSKPPGAS